MPRREKPPRRNLRPGVCRLEPDRKRSHDFAPASVRGTLHAHGLECPARGQLRGDEPRALGFDKVDELAQRHFWPLELRAQRASRREVFRKGVVQGAHCDTSVLGHGRATPRSASNSTLA